MEIISKIKTEKSAYEFAIKFSAEEFSNAVNAVYKKEVKNINLPGFRKGKAPKHLIEKMLGKEYFYNDAINNLFSDNYKDLLESDGLEPIDYPHLDVESADVETGIEMKVTVTVEPEVEIGEYKGIKVEKIVYTVSEDDVAERITALQERNSRLVTAEDAAADGDTAIIDFEGFVDDVAFAGGKGEDHNLVLGSGQFIPGFEEQVVGHKAGEEFDVNVAFPVEYHAEELAGKEAVFKVKLSEVKRKEVPTVDDEFAKDVSEYDTVEELKDSLRKEMSEANEERSTNEMKNSLVKALIEQMSGYIPPVMIEERSAELARDFEMRVRSQGMDFEMYLQYINKTAEEFVKGFAEEAENQVKSRLVLKKVALLEGFEVSDEEYEEEVKRIAERYNTDVERVKGAIPSDDVKADVCVQRAVDKLAEYAEVTEKEYVEEAPESEEISEE